MQDTLFWANKTFENIVEEYSDLVTHICFIRLRNFHNVKDCYQNVFLKLYKKRPHFESEEHLKAWLAKVASNECKDFVRRSHRQRTCSLEEIAMLMNKPEDGDLLQAVLALPEKSAEVIYLHYYQGFKVSEIALLLKGNENTIKSQLLRAREILKLQIGGTVDE